MLGRGGSQATDGNMLGRGGSQAIEGNMLGRGGSQTTEGNVLGRGDSQATEGSMLGREGTQTTEGNEAGEEGAIRLFVGVLTSGQNAEARAAVRSSWGKNPQLHRVMFFAAKPRDPQVFLP